MFLNIPSDFGCVSVIKQVKIAVSPFVSVDIHLAVTTMQQSSSSSSKQGQEKIRIRLWTTHVQYTVTDAPLAVPSKLGRYGLSEVVNHLLGSEDEPQPFDFILNGHLIRGSLKKYLAEQRVSTEEVVAIEYIPAVSLSGESDTVEVPAWVGCLDSRVDGLAIAGCYDGKIQLIDTSTMVVTAAVMAHDEPIRSVITWRMHPQKIAANQGGIFMATASKDNSVKIWSIQGNNQGSSLHTLHTSSLTYTFLIIYLYHIPSRCFERTTYSTIRTVKRSYQQCRKYGSMGKCRIQWSW